MNRRAFRPQFARSAFRWSRESPGWQQRHPLGPVHWDLRCEQCGFTIEDAATVGTGRFSATRHGITITERASKEMICTTCAPLRP